MFEFVCLQVLAVYTSIPGGQLVGRGPFLAAWLSLNVFVSSVFGLQIDRVIHGSDKWYYFSVSRYTRPDCEPFVNVRLRRG